MMKKPALAALHFLDKAVPGLRVARTYKRRWLWVDVLAGVTIFAMLVPQGIAYAQLAGVAPVVGLYTAIGALLGYALFGSSQRLMIGPESTTALLVASAVAPVATGSDPARYALLVTLMALLIVYRFDAPLFYANADYFLSQVQELIDKAHPAIDWLLIDAEAIVDIDVTAVEALSKLQSELERKGVIMAIARASQPLQEILKRAGLTERIGSAHFYPTVRTGVRAFIEQQEELTGETS